MNKYFDGDFDLLPLRSALDSDGHISDEPGAFESAVSALRDAEDRSGGYLTWEVAAARWRVEAVRERRLNGHNADLNAPAILRRTAHALAEWCRA